MIDELKHSFRPRNLPYLMSHTGGTTKIVLCIVPVRVPTTIFDLMLQIRCRCYVYIENSLVKPIFVFPPVDVSRVNQSHPLLDGWEGEGAWGMEGQGDPWHEEHGVTMHQINTGRTPLYTINHHIPCTDTHTWLMNKHTLMHMSHNGILKYTVIEIDFKEY